ncbi:hypothetical protein pVco7_gp037 [Vibrio phage pVco-7]|uniref:Uncharacterized protein n=1 Tax=Vibrio phage pVco-5 TaxID=1965485 RepID=A0A1W6JUU5_9CAUD|nr:hypothetical protein KNT61_gp038 [Vibrio phage pVco-5]ARM71026.1 hypothetical protein pVco5_038 [Vibrio phage pVco-5]
MRTLALLILSFLAVIICQEVLPYNYRNIASLLAVLGLLWVFHDVLGYWAKFVFAVIVLILGVLISIITFPFYMAGRAFQKGQIAAIKETQPKENKHDF